MHNISVNVSCDKCHGTTSAVTNQLIVPDVGTGCIFCHNANGSATSKIDTTLFGVHTSINNTDGGLTDSDCQACHFNTTGMGTGYQVQEGVNVYTCLDCHITGNYSAPIISNHRPPKVTPSPGGSITTGAYCTVCHNNSINSYAYSINASVSHYGTNTTLVKPTVNQTAMPRFGFVAQADATAYNTECNKCHNPSNPNYGNATLITMPHTSLGTCKECHVNASASDLHNVSLGIPQAFGCLDCHTTYASQYNAPNITGTSMATFGTCGSCHGGDSATGIVNSATHNRNRYYSGSSGRSSTGTVYLNSLTSIVVQAGTRITVTSNVSDSPGAASRVGGAEYFIDNDPGLGKGIPMNPADADGMFDAVNGASEPVNATIDTSLLSSGNHTVFVRGMDIEKNWSTTKNAIITVVATGYINGTVTNGGLPVSGVSVCTTGNNYTTGSDGFYSLNVGAGTYTVIASEQPAYYDNSTTGIIVTTSNTTVFNIVLNKKPTGTISGTVRIV
ncbi:Cytochrome c7 c [uncultured archaeon]|nr:Cytochrome c7 c [uncultured archaeon]